MLFGKNRNKPIDPEVIKHIIENAEPIDDEIGFNDIIKEEAQIDIPLNESTNIVVDEYTFPECCVKYLEEDVNKALNMEQTVTNKELFNHIHSNNQNISIFSDYLRLAVRSENYDIFNKDMKEALRSVYSDCYAMVLLGEASEQDVWKYKKMLKQIKYVTEKAELCIENKQWIKDEIETEKIVNEVVAGIAAHSAGGPSGKIKFNHPEEVLGKTQRKIQEETEIEDMTHLGNIWDEE